MQLKMDLDIGDVAGQSLHHAQAIGKKHVNMNPNAANRKDTRI